MQRTLSSSALILTLFAGLVHADPVETDVRVDVPEEGVVLAGTLTLPADATAASPAVLLLTGSGPQDRDSTIFGKKPFVVLAQELNKRGYAVLRCDDRGTAGSTGTFAGSTLDNFVLDAHASIDWLSQHESINPDRVFVLGHSEGASIAAELAAAGHITGGAVYLGGTALPGHAVLTDQAVRLMQAEGMPEEMLASIGIAHRALMQAVIDDADEETLLSRTMELVQAQTPMELPEFQLRAAAQAAIPGLNDPWMRRFMAHDPAQAIAQSTVPGLALFGSLDMQVSDEANAGPMADALHASGHPGSRVVVVPGKNHLFQSAQTGAMREYGALPDDLAPQVAGLIADWLDEQTGSAASDEETPPR